MALKKIKKYGQAVVGGIKDYSGEVKKANSDAEGMLIRSGSQVQDVKNLAQTRRKLLKERGVSVKKSIKKRMDS